MPNETMQMSPSGRTALRQRERAVLSYYNDAANNCTYGVGTLAHRGPCTVASSKHRRFRRQNKRGLDEAGAAEMLADCNADQQSMYFCAWRDKIVAERSLDRVAAEKKAAMPTCAAAVDEWIRLESARRDKACVKQASTNFGGGSLEPTARMTCAKDATNGLRNKLAGIDDCRRLPSL
jgi:Lysozyme inhibitor LprI